MILTQKQIERFWSNVDRRGEAECWPWLRYQNEDGYGTIKLNGQMEKSHRVAWAIDRNRQIPELFEGHLSMICHCCDNPSCCNPTHLFLGNNKINLKDSVDKGRQALLMSKYKGENHHRARITEPQVKEIKCDLEEGKLIHKQIAKVRGVSRKVVTDINTGKTWSHIVV